MHAASGILQETWTSSPNMLAASLRVDIWDRDAFLPLINVVFFKLVSKLLKGESVRLKKRGHQDFVGDKSETMVRKSDKSLHAAAQVGAVFIYISWDFQWVKLSKQRFISRVSPGDDRKTNFFLRWRTQLVFRFLVLSVVNLYVFRARPVGGDISDGRSRVHLQANWRDD